MRPSDEALVPIAPETAPDCWAVLRLVPGGDGLTRLSDGRVAFASGALPGDQIRPLEIEDRKSYVRATRWELVSAGPDRVTAACPVADRCGGCDWMALSRPAELTNKSRVLREALVRTGGFTELPVELPIVSAGSELRYRNRLRLHVDQGGRVGLYARGTHDLVEIPGCLVSDPEIDRALERVRAAGKLEPRALAAVDQIEIRVAPAGARVVVRLHPKPRAEQGALEPLVQALSSDASLTVVIAGGDEARGEQKFPLPGGLDLEVGPAAFTQVNWAVNQALVSAVVAGAKARGVRRFLDLYAGAGNFTLPLLAGGMSGIAIDHTDAAITNAARSAREKHLAGGTFLAGDVGARLRRIAHSGERFDLVLIDPPRTGARDVLPWVIELRPQHLALCACDPVTLARDLRTLARAGWQLDEVTGFDMFPRTHHVEALAWMRRRRAD
jgi:23S rRNA (uracil1939-C5)-methyltransferase